MTKKKVKPKKKKPFSPYKKAINSKEVMSQLCEANIGLLYKLVGQMKHIPESYRDEAISYAFFTMAKCARLFDTKKGFVFGSYFGNCLKRALCSNRWMEALKVPKKPTINLSAISDFDWIPQEEKPNETPFHEWETWRFLEELPEHQRNILLMAQTHTLKEVGEHFGISKTRVQQIRDWAIAHMKHTAKKQAKGKCK